MIRLSVFLSIYLMHAACINSNVETKTKSIAPKESFKNTILWTVDASPDGKFYAIGGDDKLLRIYKAKDLKLFKTYKLSTAIQCVDWNPDSKLLAIASDDFPTQLLNIETEKFIELKGSNASRALAWNYNGELLAIGDAEGLLQIWSKEGKLISSTKKENTKSYLSVDWHPKKDIILTGSDKIRLFDTSCNLLKTIKHRAEETIILTVKWHPHGAFFAIGDYGHKEEQIESLLQFWNEDGTLIRSLSGSKAEYRNIRWNKNGELLATASDALRLWSKDGKIIYTGKSEDLLWGIDWDMESKNIITTSNNGNINLWTNEARLVRAIP